MRERAKSSGRALGTISEQRAYSHEKEHRPSSQDTLVNAKAFPRVDSEDTLVEGKTMSSTEETVALERRRSYCIGGAGNMRKSWEDLGHFPPSNTLIDMSGLPSVVKAAKDAPEQSEEGQIACPEFQLAGR